MADSWDTTDLTGVNRGVERDLKEQAKAMWQDDQLQGSACAESAGHELRHDHRMTISNESVEAQRRPIKNLVPKKRRPINGFSTNHREDNDGTIDPAVFRPAHHPPIPPAPKSVQPGQSDEDAPKPEGDKAPMAGAAAPSTSSTPEYRSSPGPVKLKLKAGPKPTEKKTSPSRSRKVLSTNRSPRAASISATKKRKATEALDTQASTPNGSNHYGDTPASQITHFGPVYPTRRAVLNRDSRPYIHLACGSRFSHPSDVKAHARKGNQARGCGDLEKWNEHPSCQADYVHIRYARVKEGFVILDQESWDRLESAVQAGLAYASEHPQPETQVSDPPASKAEKASKKKPTTKKRTTTKKKTVRNPNFPPVEELKETTKYEFEFDTEGDADAEGEVDPGEDKDESILSAAPSVAAVTMSGVANDPPARVPNAEPEKSEREGVAQPPEPEWEWDGTALRAAALGLRKRPRL